MTLEELLPWTLAAYLALQSGFLWFRLERERRRVLELQDERVSDVKWMASMERGSAEVDQVPTPEQAAREKLEELEPDDEGMALKDLSEEEVFEHLQARAREEGRTVSEKTLRDDAKRIVQRFGLGPAPPKM